MPVRFIIQILSAFNLRRELDTPQVVYDTIESRVPFRGTNLWMLVLAIFVACLGLNLNSASVLIGAMLISPLMGPTVGMGVGIGIYDLALFRKALYNYCFATVVALSTSTLYFSVSPIDQASSELLSYTSANVYHAIIAFIGGMAGILGVASKTKGNIVAGVAIATALLPPLCTAGYGLANGEWSYLLGALYFYLINTVFIAISSLLTIRLLRYPKKDDVSNKSRTNNIVTILSIVTIIPSIYFAWQVIQQQQFENKVKTFIDQEAQFPNDYILSKKWNYDKRQIELVYGGVPISEAQIAALEEKLISYKLQGTELVIKQGFSNLDDESKKAVDEKELIIKRMSAELDSLKNGQRLSDDLLAEVSALYPAVKALHVQNRHLSSSDTVKNTTLVTIYTQKDTLNETAREQLQKWLHMRLKQSHILVINAVLPQQ